MATIYSTLMSAARKRLHSPHKGPSVGELAAKVQRLVALNVDFECLLESVPGWNKGVGTDVVRHHVRSMIEVKPDFQMFTEDEVLENLVIVQARNSVQSSDLEALSRVAALAERLREEGLKLEGAAADMEIVNKVDKAEVSWLLHKSGLATLDQQWDEKWAGDVRRSYLDSLEQQCRLISEAGVGLVAALVSLLYRGKHNVSRMLLDRLLRRLLDHIYNSEEKEDVKEQSWSWISFHSLPHSQRKVWAKFAIRILVTHGIIKVGEAVANQAEWREEHSSLSEFASALARAGLEAKEVVEEVARLVERQEVNWRGLLALVTASLALPGVETEWWKLVNDLVERGSGDGEGGNSSLLVGILLARQVVGPGHKHTSYQAWFAASFAEEASTLAQRPQSLLELLNSMLPFEPAVHLRAHLARPPWLPKHHLALFEDYKDLARARLQELSEKPIQAPSSQAIEEAIAAIKEFAETSKIPKCLSDCWMWQRDTWNTRLLPAILTCSTHTQLLSEGRQRLVEALNEKGKVSGHLYSRFKAGTLLETEIKPEGKETVHLVSLEELLDDADLLEDSELRRVLDQAKVLVKKLRGDGTKNWTDSSQIG